MSSLDEVTELLGFLGDRRDDVRAVIGKSFVNFHAMVTLPW
jgi:hypothetical protein